MNRTTCAAIRRRRESLGLTIWDAADQCEITPDAYGEYESPFDTPLTDFDSDEIKRLADVLGWGAPAIGQIDAGIPHDELPDLAMIPQNATSTAWVRAARHLETNLLSMSAATERVVVDTYLAIGDDPERTDAITALHQAARDTGLVTRFYYTQGVVARALAGEGDIEPGHTNSHVALAAIVTASCALALTEIVSDVGLFTDAQYRLLLAPVLEAGLFRIR